MAAASGRSRYGADHRGHRSGRNQRRGRRRDRHYREWARMAIALHRQHAADRIVAEVNNGGDMVENTIRMVDPNSPLLK
jgi:phage terminase large subunit-like protein